MTNARTLTQLIDLARRSVDTAARKLGASNSRAAEEQAKLAALRQYQIDYQARFDEAVRRGIGPGQLRNFHEFICKLDAAIRHQEEIVAQHEMRTDTCRRSWTAANRTLKSYDTLASRARAQEATKSARREQREQDEAAARTSHGHAAQA